MSKSDYLEDKLLNHILRGVSYTSPGTVYLALYTTATDDDGSGTEVPDSNAYARTAVTFGAPSPSGTTKNSVACTFPQASDGGWGLIGWAALVDSATWGGGNFLYHGALSATKQIDVLDQLTFPINNITVTEA